MCLGRRPKRSGTAKLRLALPSSTSATRSQGDHDDDLLDASSHQLDALLLPPPVKLTAGHLQVHKDQLDGVVTGKRGSDSTLSTVSSSSVISDDDDDADDDDDLSLQDGQAAGVEAPKLKSCLKTQNTEIIKAKTKNSVVFTTVQIRSYPVTMGDFTSSFCSGHGPPLILANEKMGSSDGERQIRVMPVDRYEKISSAAARRRKIAAASSTRTSSEAAARYQPLSATVRRRILMDRWGYSFREVLQREKEIADCLSREVKASGNDRYFKRQVNSLGRGIKKRLVSHHAHSHSHAGAD